MEQGCDLNTDQIKDTVYRERNEIKRISGDTKPQARIRVDLKNGVRSETERKGAGRKEQRDELQTEANGETNVVL